MTIATAMVSLNRVPPQDVDAERAVLGALLLTGDNAIKIPEVRMVLSAGTFYREAHNVIFSAICELFDKGEPVDLLTVGRQLESNNELEQVGGIPYLDEMLDSCPTSANAVYYADMVKEDWIRRQVIYNSAKSYNAAFDSTIAVADLLNDAEAGVLSIRRDTEKSRLVSVKDAIKDAFYHIQRLYQSKERVIGIPTGFVELDQMTSGMQPADYILIAGRPSMGKSTLAQNIVQHLAVTEDYGVALFSLEMNCRSLAMRILASESGMDFQEMRTGRISETQWASLTIAAGKIAEAKIMIDDSTNITPSQLRGKLHQILPKQDVDLVLVDYLQLMSADTKSDNREKEVSSISRALKAIARDFDVPLIAVSQLSRKPEGRTGEQRRPQLSDLRESGALEQDADIVLFLYREQYYDKSSTNDLSELIIGKQRNGPTGTIKLGFDGSRMMFKNLSEWKQ